MDLDVGPESSLVEDLFLLQKEVFPSYCCQILLIWCLSLKLLGLQI